MKKIKRILSAVLPVYSYVPLIVATLWNCLGYFATRLVTTPWHHYYLTLPLDNRVPLVPWTISIYFLSYPFWFLNYYLCAREEKSSAYRLLCADFLVKGIAIFFFLLIPSTLERPQVTGSGLWNDLVRWLYISDAPDNLFPSIHCIASTLSAVGIRKNKKIPLWYRLFSFLMMIAICISTLTTRQHVIVDVIGGVGFALLCYYLAGLPAVRSVYARCMDSLNGFFASAFLRENNKREE